MYVGYKSRLHLAATKNAAEARAPEPAACSDRDSEVTRSLVGGRVPLRLGRGSSGAFGGGGCSAVRACAGQLGSAAESNHE